MDVKVVEVNHCAFVDFAEETAAARVVEKAQERPFVSWKSKISSFS